MPTFRHGKNTKVLFDKYDLSAYYRDASVGQQADTAETTAFGSTVKTYVMGVIGGSASLSGMFAGDANGVDQVLQSVYGGETPRPLVIGFEGLGTVGSRVLGGLGHLTNYQVQGTVSDMVSVSSEFQCTGGIIGGYNLRSFSTVLAAPGNATPINGTAVLDAGNIATTNGGFATLQVIGSNVTVGTAVIKIQHSVDNSVWADLLTFTTLTAGSYDTAEAVTIAKGTTINKYTRVVVTFQAAATGNLYFSSTIHRYAA